MGAWMGRRVALLGAGLLLARRARAAEDAARTDAALRALAGNMTAELDRNSATLEPWPGGPRPGLWIVAAMVKSRDDYLRAGVLEEGSEGWSVLASGNADPLTVALPPRPPST